MDDFDDLLASSSNAFDENPFASPFSNARSTSPDPWATFGQEQTTPDFGKHTQHDFDEHSYPAEFQNKSPRVSEDSNPIPNANANVSTAPSPFTSPLIVSDTEITKPFASLALGGESTSGWRDDQVVAPANPEPETSNGIKEETKLKEAPSSKERYFYISVGDPQKVGDPIRPYILYTVATQTNSAMFNKPSFSVLRRYSDFLWLYETLSINNPGAIVPPVPEKSSFGRFDNQFVQQRRSGLEKCIQKIVNHPVLCKDPNLKLFLESDTFSLDVKHQKAEAPHLGSGLMSSIGQTITGPKFHEVDDWFDRKRSYLDGLESQLRSLVKSIEVVSRQRSELASTTEEFTNALRELSGTNLNGSLSNLLAAMANVEKKSHELHSVQAQEDTMTFMNIAEEYARIVGSVRLAFASRVRMYTFWQNAESELRRVRQGHERARQQGRAFQERSEFSLAHVTDVERKALSAKADFERCGKTVKSELGRFEEERISGFKVSLEAYLEGMIQRQKQLITSWESFQDMLSKKTIHAEQQSPSEDLSAQQEPAV